MKLKVYVDTTVISAAEDMRAPDRREQTLAFFSRAEEFDLVSSELTRTELLGTPNADLRSKLLARLQPIPCISIAAEMVALAKEYVGHDIIPPAYEDDAIHIAAAVLSGQDVLTSWNFRHLVNRRRRSLVNLLNASQGLRTIEILTPPEL